MKLGPVILLAIIVATSGSPALAADDKVDAESLYKSTCMPCHMADGNAALEPMNFVDGNWKHGSSVKQVAATITNGVQGTAMMPFKGRFSEQEILALARYVRKFDKNLAAGTAAKKAAPVKK
jgi:mono/diheme cytochrome c family protein